MLPLTSYNADVTCQTGGTGACYTITNNVDTLAVFSAVVTNPAAITFTVVAMITDRSYISNWMVVHMIRVGTRMIGFYSWPFQI